MTSPGWRSRRVLATVLLAGALALGGAPSGRAETAKRAHVGRVVKESVKTGGRAARDGVLTFGRATRDFFTKGPAAAKRTWKTNAARTKETAKAGGRAVRAAAGRH